MSKLNFAIHCGGREVTEVEVDQAARPAATRSYCPVPHLGLANLIERSAKSFGFAFGEQAHALNRGGNQYFGMAELRHENENDTFALVAGWRNSYDKSLAASFVVGSQVFVCDNLAFSGEQSFDRKHTANVLRDLPTLVRGAVSQTEALAQKQEARYTRYQAAIVTKDSIANDTIIRLLQIGAITTQRVERVVNEYYEPSHIEHLNGIGNRTIWTLFNAATEAMKGVGLAQLPKRTMALHGAMDEVANSLISAQYPH